MSESDTSSVMSSSSDGSNIEHLILDQPMYYVMNQFLVTDDGINIATCVENLTKELNDIKKMMATLLHKMAGTPQ